MFLDRTHEVFASTKVKADAHKSIFLGIVLLGLYFNLSQVDVAKDFT